MRRDWSWTLTRGRVAWVDVRAGWADAGRGGRLVGGVDYAAGWVARRLVGWVG